MFFNLTDFLGSAKLSGPTGRLQSLKKSAESHSAGRSNVGSNDSRYDSSSLLLVAAQRRVRVEDEVPFKRRLALHFVRLGTSERRK